MIVNYFAFFSCLILFTGIAIAQPPTDKVSQLIASENYFAALVKEKGIKKGFLAVSDENTIVFRPGPVKAAEFYKNLPDTEGILAWEPVYARISKSGDWGVTTGPYTFRKADTNTPISYGDYFSVWKKNKKGIWKLAIDIGVPHPKPTKTPKLEYINPVSERFIHQYGSARLQQREDIVVSSDRLYATILKADNKIARKEFLTDETTLLFPDSQPIKGKAAVTAFWENKQIKLSSQALHGDRAFSGELAFTYGNASTEINGKSKNYYYVRLWELQPEFKWAVLLEVYVPE